MSLSRKRRERFPYVARTRNRRVFGARSTRCRCRCSPPVNGRLTSLTRRGSPGMARDAPTVRSLPRVKTGGDRSCSALAPRFLSFSFVCPSFFLFSTSSSSFFPKDRTHARQNVAARDTSSHANAIGIRNIVIGCRPAS